MNGDLQQSEPNHEPNEESNDANYECSKEELEIIDDENPPDFYDQFDVLWLTKRFDWLIKIMIAFTILYNVLNYPTSTSIVQYFNLERSNSIWAYIIAFAVTIASTIISIILMYIPLKALSHILRILMEMEFRSRKAS